MISLNNCFYNVWGFILLLSLTFVEEIAILISFHVLNYLYVYSDQKHWVYADDGL